MEIATKYGNSKKCFQVHANTAHAEHAAVGEEARQALREELANEYQLYQYIRFISTL